MSKEINLFADITTASIQSYTGNTNIGSNEVIDAYNYGRLVRGLTGTNGFVEKNPQFVPQNNQSFVRTLISEDPAIYFNGPVNDTIENTHTLAVFAIAQPNTEKAIIRFSSTVGSTKPLYALMARSLMYVEGNLLPSGGVALGGNVTTAMSQTYSGEKYMQTGSEIITLNSRGGKIKIETGSYDMDYALRLSYTFSNQPEIDKAAGLIKAPDDVREMPSDLGAGTLNSMLRKKIALQSDSTDESITASVQVDDIQDASDAKINCDVPSADTNSECTASTR
jgi:hypothetical protein